MNLLLSERLLVVLAGVSCAEMPTAQSSRANKKAPHASGNIIIIKYLKSYDCSSF